MDDWELLFLQAAGKGGARKEKRAAQVPDETLSRDGRSSVETKYTVNATENENTRKKVKLSRARGTASRCLKLAGFGFDKTFNFVCEKSFAARYTMKDLLPMSSENCRAPLSIIRRMFLLVRNTRATGFAPCCKSTPSVANSYAKSKKEILEALVELESLAASCPAVRLAKEHIQDSIRAASLLSVDVTERDCESATANSIVTKNESKKSNKAIERRMNSTQRCEAACLQLMASLDSIYGELLVAAIDNGISLPDPRLYLESLCGQTDNCVVSGASAKSGSSNGSAASDSHIKNPLLRYLELRSIEAEALNIQQLSKSAADLEGLGPGPNEGTMRGTDPLSCSTVRAWWHAVRFRVAAWSAFACPNDQAINALRAFSKGCGLIEMGAGVGYWALLLRNAGIDVLAYDKLPPSSSSSSSGKVTVKQVASNEYHGRFDAWSEVLFGDAAARCDTNRVLLLCYPPPNDPMAVRTLRGYTGCLVAYVGETQGDTGTLDFELLLASDWNLTQAPIKLPNFGNTCYSLTLWTRKEKSRKSNSNGKCLDNDNDNEKSHGKEGGGESTATSSSSSLLCWTMRCAECDALPQNTTRQATFFLRDRLTRAVWVCSEECARGSSARTSVRREMQLRHISYGLSDDPAQDDDIWKRVKLQ